MSEPLTSLQKANLVPGAASSLIPSSFTPSADLAVSFGDVEVHMGNMLRVSAVQQRPSLTFKLEVQSPLLVVLLVSFLRIYELRENKKNAPILQSTVEEYTLT